MTSSPKKQRRGAETRDKILKIALKLFSEKGYDKVTVDEIVKKSGTSKGSFYQHFSAKSDIFLMKFSQADDYYLEVYQSFTEDLDALEKLSLFVRKIMDFLEREMGKDLMKVTYSAALDSKEHTYFSNLNRSLFQIIFDLLKEGKANEIIDQSKSIDQMATLIIQSLMGIIYHWGINDSNQSLESLSIPLTTIIAQGLRA